MALHVFEVLTLSVGAVVWPLRLLSGHGMRLVRAFT